ncbi:probable LysR-family transcriptional regulator [Bordetella bronchiseptica MO211]|nr:probable LysR-family transcriptional regulator [Bordetella bronchiseptica MO211]
MFMDMRFLRSFVTVAESGSIADAARRLDLAPTTVGAADTRPGSRPGLAAAHARGTDGPADRGGRAHRGPRARIAARRTRPALGRLGHRPAGRPHAAGRDAHALMGLVPPLLRRWMRAHPDIQIYIEPGTSSVLLERVMAGQLDAAILVHPNFELHKTCAWSLIREERLVLLAPSALRVGNALRVAAREPFIQYDRKVVAGKMADAYLRAHGVRPKVQFELDGIEHISALVAEGFGVSVLPDWPTLGPADTRVRRWPLPDPCPSRQVGMVWLRSSVRSPLAQAFHAYLGAAAGAP